MIEALVNHLLNNAPSLAVLVVLAVILLRRMSEIEDRVLNMLEQCWQNMFNHLNEK